MFFLVRMQWQRWRVLTVKRYAKRVAWICVAFNGACFAFEQLRRTNDAWNGAWAGAVTGAFVVGRAGLLSPPAHPSVPLFEPSAALRASASADAYLRTIDRSIRSSLSNSMRRTAIGAVLGAGLHWTWQTGLPALRTRSASATQPAAAPVGAPPLVLLDSAFGLSHLFASVRNTLLPAAPAAPAPHVQQQQLSSANSSTAAAPLNTLGQLK
jgi:hypothetical protein